MDAAPDVERMPAKYWQLRPAGVDKYLAEEDPTELSHDVLNPARVPL